MLQGKTVAITGIILAILLFVLPVGVIANPPADEDTVVRRGPMAVTSPTKSTSHKEIDRPNIKDYLRLRARQRLIEKMDARLREGKGQDVQLLGQINTLATTGTDRVLVILVEFAGTDNFDWTPGVSTWDPYGKADPSEYTGTADGSPAACDNIISQHNLTGTTKFTYTGPLHNDIERPLSADDRSGDMIWVPDFSKQYYEGIVFGNGVVFDYSRQDSSQVHEDFTGKSVRNYYLDMSGGQYGIAGDIVGWVQVPHSIWWYGADPCPGARSGASVNHNGGIPGAGSARSLVGDAIEAVKAAYPLFNWAQYDQDGDGVIDRLWIIHAGLGEEDSTTLLDRTDYGEGGLWSHSSSLSPYYTVVPGIQAGPYIMMPENSGIGVLAHEYGHNLGADDLYSYGEGEPSAGFWTIMADDWTGYPIAFQPPAADPRHLDNWGWLNPFVAADAAKSYVVTVGQASDFPGGPGIYRGVRIPLADGHVPLSVTPNGNYQWWGGKEDNANAVMTMKNQLTMPAGPAALSFNLAYDIEDEWDFLWVQVSDDGGSTWKTLTNSHTSCIHDPGWIGGYYGFPDDLCSAGIGGVTGNGFSFPYYGQETFDLSSFAGKNILLRFWYMTDWGTTGQGPFVDDIVITSGSSAIFSDDAESGDAKWVYTAPWSRNDGTSSFTHNYYLQWRNVGTTGGYDSALGDSRWRYGPANTGLLVWYNNNLYGDNEVFNYLFDAPGFGSKGLMLVVDAHPEPYRDPYYVTMGYDNEGGNVPSRSLMRDATFSLQNSVDFVMRPPYVYDTTAFSGLPAVSMFDDSFGRYPGAEFVSRGPGYSPPSIKWITGQWDASVVLPSTAFYGIKALGYTADEEFRWDCAKMIGGPNDGRLSCYYLGANTGLGYNGGTGDPKEVGGDYGWKVKVVRQTDEQATLRIWNKLCVSSQSFSDAGPGYWAEQFIKNIACNEITAGCGGGNYCPESPVTRGQMAVFILKTLGLQPAATCTGNVFTDVNNAMNGGSAFCRYVEKFKELNITSGCAADRYCPDDPVTRAQMAVFITKALDQQPAAACSGTFTDVNEMTGGNSGFCRYIEKFSTLGITSGCGDGSTYCPDDSVTRAQMAVFLTKGFLQ